MSAPTIGIDFGTTTSSMAWVDPRTGEAKTIKNAEGEEKTPSVVYFGERETLVGSPAEQMLEDESERRRVVQSVKRELVNTRTLALPGRRVKAVEVAAEVLKKLKRDAEDLHFHESVERAVVTCPAAFGPLERDEIERAARLAGFAEVRLLEEPVAAALAYSRQGLGIGRHILVYDLGGGTFDLALLREVDGSYELAMEPKGLPSCGGDDFDIALYEWCEDEALLHWGAPIDERGLDLQFLRDCRKRKESLSVRDQVQFSSLIGAGRVFKHTLTRDLLESIIGPRVEATVRLTGELVRTAMGQGYEVDTVVLIGGSTRIPLVQRRLSETLPVEPHRWQHQDVAVALGAAYFAQGLWPLWLGSDRMSQAARELRMRAIEFFATHRKAQKAFVDAVCLGYPFSEALIDRYVEQWNWWCLSGNRMLPWSEALIDRYVERWDLGRVSADWGSLSGDRMPWSDARIERFAERWGWGSLSVNTMLPWSDALIERFAERWEWKALSENPALPWNVALIEHHAKRWDWDRLSRNKSLPWSDELIERFAKRWHWSGGSSSMSWNESLPWSDALIERYAERWDWDTLSWKGFLPWSESLIERCIERWNWRKLSANKMLPWSEALIERFVERWDWNELGRNESLPWSESLIERYDNRWDWAVLSGNKSLPWSEAFIERRNTRERHEVLWRSRDVLSWNALSRNPALPWSEVLIEKFKWDWKGLSCNVGLPWSEMLIERYAERWDWKLLSQNSALPWSEALIERFAEQWAWDDLTRNVSLPWNEALIDRFATRWNFSILSCKKSMLWNETLIERYAKGWNWPRLSENAALPWSEELIERFAERWDWSTITFWVLSKLVKEWTEPEICDVMDRIASLSIEIPANNAADSEFPFDDEILF